MKLTIGTVIRSLDSRFEEFNFDRKSAKYRGHSYYKWINEDTRLSVGPGIRNIAGVVRIDTPQIGIRFDSVEKLAAQFQEHHPNLPITAEDIAVRGTLDFFPEPQGILGGFFRKTWNIWKVNEIEPATQDFVSHVMKAAKPFWDKYSDPEAALALLQRDDEEARDLGGADHFRAERAVTMTFLRRGFEEAKRLAEAKLPKIRNDSYREEFRGWMARFLQIVEQPPG